MKYTYLVVHHSATPPNTSVDEIRQAHLARGFDDIGYHYLIDPRGTVHCGRSEMREGAHAYGLNSESIGVCCIGNFEETSIPSEQFAALVGLCRDVCAKFHISPNNIIGHSEALHVNPEATPTVCPGRFLYDRIGELQQRVKVALPSGHALPQISVGLEDADVVTISGVLSRGSLDRLYQGETRQGSLAIRLQLFASATPKLVEWESSVQLIRDPENSDQLLFTAYLPQACLRPDFYYCEGRSDSGQSAHFTSGIPDFRFSLQLPLAAPFLYAVPSLRSLVAASRLENTGPYLVRLVGRVLNTGSLNWINHDERSPYRIGAMVVSATTKQDPFLELRYDLARAEVLVGDEVPFSFTFDTTELPPGDYVAHIDVVKERHLWFSEIGGVGDSVPFTVTETKFPHTSRKESLLSPPSIGAAQSAVCSIVYIAPTVPLYDRSTGGRRLIELFKMLVEEGISVTFLYQQIGTFTNPARYLGVLDAIGVSHALDPLGYLSDLNVSRKFSLCVIGWYSLAAQMLPAIRTLLPGVRVVVDSVDIHWARERSAQITKVSNVTEEQAATEKQKEVAVYYDADEVWVVSSAEAHILHSELPATKTRVIGIPCEIATGFQETRLGRSVLFVGGFAHPPNVSAAIWAADIVTEFNYGREIPVPLTIVGADPPPEVIALGRYDNIKVLGYVESLDQVYADAAVFLCPLRAGGGVKGKICEAISYGIPVVTNSLGNEGLSLVPDVEILLAESTSEFLAQLRKVFDEGFNPDSLRKRGLQALLRLYGRDAVKNQLIRACVMPHVVVAIVTYNKRELLRACVYSILEKTTYPHYTVAIVSNACTDGTLDLVRDLEGRYPGKVKLYPSEQNLFFVRPNNHIIKQFPDSDVVLVNNDVEVVNGGWLTNLVDAAYSSTDVCGSGGLVLDTEGKVSEAGAEIYASGVGINLSRGSDPGQGSAQAIRSVGFVSGCLMYMRRDAINIVGPLDDDFHPMYFEDAAWHYKAHTFGLRTVYTPWTVVIHKEGSSAGTDVTKGMKRYQEINREKFLAKFDGIDFDRFNRGLE